MFVAEHHGLATGMRWTPEGAQIILSLRALVLTESRWHQFWQKINTDLMIIAIEDDDLGPAAAHRWPLRALAPNNSPACSCVRSSEASRLR